MTEEQYIAKVKKLIKDANHSNLDINEIQQLIDSLKYLENEYFQG